MKTTSLIAFLLASTSALAAQTAPGVATTWTVAGSVQGVTWEETCTLTVDTAKKLTGTCKIGDASPYAVTGTMDGANVMFSHDGEYQGSAIGLMFTGKVAADGTVAGDVAVSPSGASGTFTAKQAKATVPAQPAVPVRP